MSSANYEILFFGWCREGRSDKVWGFIRVGGGSDLFNFWGRRGATLTWKRYAGSQRLTLDRLGRSKIGKGYTEVPIDEIEQHTPGFTDEFERNFVMARLMDRFHGKETV